MMGGFLSFSLVVLWCFFNSCMGILNKTLFTQEQFHYPIFLTSFHMLASFICAVVTVKCKILDKASVFPDHMALKTIFKIFLLSLMFCSSVSLGNIGLKYLNLSFIQMIAATTPAVTLLFDILLFQNMKKYSSLSLYSMIPLTLGTMFCTMGEVNFVLFGFLCSSCSVLLRGVRTLLQGFLLQEENIHSIHLLLFMSLPSFGILLMWGIAVESEMLYDANIRNLKTLGILFISCFNAFIMNIFNFLVTFHTSAVTLQVIGSCKFILDIMLSQLIFGNDVSLLSWFGALMTLFGSGLFWASKTITLKKEIIKLE